MYKKINDKYYYLDREVLNQDINSFEIIDNYYAKDANNCYFGSRKIYEADPQTFKVFSEDIARDKTYVFYIGKVSGQIVENFQYLKESYYILDGSLYNACFELEKADLNDYEIVYSNIYKSNGKVYEFSHEMKNIDAQTFTSLGNGFTKDKNNIFYHTSIVEGADLETFEAIENKYYFSLAKDKSNLYCTSFKLKDSDPATLELCGSHYYKDKNNVYYYSSTVEYANPKTFQRFEVNSTIAIDDKYVFVNGKKKQEHFNQFKYLSENYYQVKDKIYYSELVEPLEDIDDPSQFKVLLPQTIKTDKYIYSLNEKTDLDIDSFEILNDIFYRDAKSIYIRGIKHDYVDVESFQLFKDMGHNWAYDKNGVYDSCYFIEGADHKSFEYITEYIYKDNKKVYIFDKFVDEYLIVDCDAQNVTFLSKDFFTDGKNVFYYDEKVEGANPDHFEILDLGYAKDDKRIYHGKETLIDSIDTNLKVYSSHFAIDDHHLYFHEKRVKIDKESLNFFHENGTYFFLDKNQVIVEGNLLDYMDPKTFEVLSSFFYRDKNTVVTNSLKKVDLNPNNLTIFDQAYCHDDKKIYFISRQIKDVDLSSIKYLGDNILTDKNSVYVRENKLEGADPASFEIIRYGKFQDKNYIYKFKYGKLIKEKIHGS